MLISDIKTNNGWLRYGPTTNGSKNQTKAYIVWYNMKRRCYSAACQERQPTYIGCTMSENFSDFQFFAQWCQSQIGYALQNYHIDKDMLICGNKLYSENTCVFIPASLNKFFNAHAATNTMYPQGVAIAACGKFTATLSIDGKEKHIALCNTPELAFAAYKVAKEAEALRWHKRLKAGEFAVDQRVIERLAVWQLQ
jgi:hypothetical protein